MARRPVAGTVRTAALGAVVAGALFVLTPSASASHACDTNEFGGQEISFWRKADYSGGCRAFTGNDTTYQNDYYTGTSIDVNNSISSYINYHSSRWYTECRYVGQDVCTRTIISYAYDSDLSDNVWPVIYPFVHENDTYSSHVYNNA